MDAACGWLVLSPLSPEAGERGERWNNRRPGQPYFWWHSREEIFLATISPPAAFGPSGST